MSNFNARRAPNVSQYLANLNTIPTPQEMSAQQAGMNNMGDDGLDFLTNTEFFDFDQFNPGVQGHYDHSQAPQHAQRPINGMPYPPEYHQQDYKPQQQQQQQQQSYPPTGMTSPSSLAPSPPANGGLQGIYPPQPAHFVHSPTTGDKRKSSIALPAGVDLEDSSRMAAEEDKRRRNTAASARFRVKKKQREQALEKQAKDMTDKVQQLESKVQQLEMENKWLKELITEKSDTKALEASLQKKSEKESEERSTESRNDGVGTLAAGKVDA